MEDRESTLRQRLIETENDLAQAREDLLILEEMIDEALGLR